MEQRRCCTSAGRKYSRYLALSEYNEAVNQWVSHFAAHIAIKHSLSLWGSLPAAVRRCQWCHFTRLRNNVSTFSGTVTVLAAHDTSHVRTLFSHFHRPCDLWDRGQDNAKSTANVLLPHLSKNITDATKLFSFCAADADKVWINWVVESMYGQAGFVLETVTHRRSPRSWRTPWLSKACSSSPSPGRGRGRRSRGRGRGGAEREGN